MSKDGPPPYDAGMPPQQHYGPGQYPPGPPPDLYPPGPPPPHHFGPPPTEQRTGKLKPG